MNRTKRTEAEQRELLAYLREHYEYEPKSGRLKNKLKGTIQKDFKSGTSKYLRFLCRINGVRHIISMHIAVWLVCKGEWPKGYIDHINNDHKDNHIENLRECSQTENNLNVIHPWEPNKDCGVPGIEKTGLKYRTMIVGKRFSFSSPYEAFYYATLYGKMYARD